jgi:pimeloyl-ACP methyl ester carboxylesterase
VGPWESVVFPGAAVPVTEREVAGSLAPGEELTQAPTTRGERVAVVHRPPGRGGRDVRNGHVLFLYGNAMTLADTPAIRQVLGRRGHGVLCLDYLGYGLSEGTPSEGGCYRAAHAGLSLLQERYGAEPGGVDVVGWSLGSAVALHVASRREVRSLTLLSPFSGVAAYALGVARLGGLRRTPLGGAGPFAGVRRAARVRCPALLVSGELDVVTPPSMARDLATAMGDRARLVTIPGTGHNDLFSRPETWVEVHRFLAGD